MVKGNIFNVDFIGESKEDILPTKVQKGKENSLSHSQKRAGINSTEETSFKKSKGLKCLACDIRGYTLPNY